MRQNYGLMMRMTEAERVKKDFDPA